MGRRNVSEERREEILDTFAALANERGLADTSLRQIAKRIGVTVPLLLHHFESRDEIVEALFERVMHNYGLYLVPYLNELKSDARDGKGDKLIHFLFEGPFTRMVQKENALFADVIGEANRNPELRKQFRGVYRDFETSLIRYLKQIAPRADDEALCDCAYALICLLGSNELFLRLGFRDGRPARAARSARLIIDDLIQSQSRQSKRNVA